MFAGFDGTWLFSLGLAEASQAPDNPATADDIHAVIRALQPETLTAVMKNVVERDRLCETENRGHFHEIIFHT